MQILKEYLDSIGFLYDNGTIEKFEIYYSELIDYNKSVNLTAITDRDEVQIKHFIDSLTAAEFIKGADTVLDIGCGAGFPSMPLAIIYPEISFTQVDSLNKRVKFLKLIKERLFLHNISPVHARAEDLDKSVKYSASVARAVAPLNILLEYLAPFTKKGGKIIVLKGSNYIEELNASENAIRLLGLNPPEIHKFNLFNTNIQRVIMVFNKSKETPLIYPRGKNLPRLKPL